MSAVMPRVGAKAFIDPATKITATLIAGSSGAWLNFEGDDWGGVNLHFQSADDMQRVADAVNQFTQSRLIAATPDLAAAAPELLEALRVVEAALIRDMGAGYSGVALCQAAIAKAAGQ